MKRLGFGEHAKKSAHCPFHDDRHNSFSVWQSADGAWFFKCHTGCGDGDEIKFLELHERLSPGDAIDRFVRMAGVNGSKAPVDWRACMDAFIDDRVAQFADWRGYSGELCSWLRKRKLVGLYKGRLATPVHDEAELSLSLRVAHIA